MVARCHSWSVFIAGIDSLGFSKGLCGADMNEFTIERTAADLAAQKLGPAGFGAETTGTPEFPLRGMLWDYQLRASFSIIGTMACFLSS